ncbi:YhgE/Pip domain-containing protein [Alicyclobacillaceae bacterium I2511]|nr:YhgE/Pip domain-containing protein [Alicyclobacillaceae bacterium I2511]
MTKCTNWSFGQYDKLKDPQGERAVNGRVWEWKIVKVSLWKSVVAEWRFIASKIGIWIPVAVVALVPLLYSGLFSWSFWNPYGKMNHLPVAVVNEDTGAFAQGQSVQVGQQLVSQLKNHHQFDWQFVSAATAAKGLQNNRYYMSVVIPANFSKDSISAFGSHPVEAQLQYTVNDRYNYISSQIETSAMQLMAAKLNQTLAQGYNQILLTDVGKLATGLHSAAAVATVLNSGAEKLAGGTQLFGSHLVTFSQAAQGLQQNLQQAAQGSAQLAMGSTQLASGAKQLSSGLKQLGTGIQPLAAGTGQFTTGLQQADAGAHALAGGLRQLNTGTGVLQGGFKQLQQAAGGLVAGAGQLQGSVQQLQSGLQQTDKGSQSLAQGNTALNQGLQQFTQDPLFAAFLAAHPQEAAAWNELEIESGQLNVGATVLAQSQGKLVQGVNGINTGFVQLQSGISQLNQNLGVAMQSSGGLGTGASQAAQSANHLAQGLAVLTTAGQRLQAGVGDFATHFSQATQAGNELSTGASQFTQHLNQLQSGLSQLNQGAGQLVNGAQALSSGFSPIQQGANQLAQGLSQYHLKWIQSDAQAKTPHFGTKTAAYLTKPVALQPHSLAQLPNYGTGFVPYFISLGLWVGALLLSIVWPMREPATTPNFAWQWLLAKFSVLFSVGIIQAAVVDTVILYGLHLHVANVPAFYGFTMLAGVTFLAIVQFFVAAFANPGRFLAVVLLVLQLTTSAGTFPVQVIPPFLQPFNVWLPMTYTVDGLRAIIGGDLAWMWPTVGKVTIFLVAALLATWGLFILLRYRVRRFRPADVHSAEAVQN